MNSKARVKSAGQPPSRNTHETLYLRDQITKLEHELSVSRAEVRSVTDRLNCLITLVKSAWSGDDDSAVHVANIVGMAPPDVVNHEDPDRMNVTYSTKPKSRAVSNWAVLTIGILNREYKRLECEIQEKQAQHLFHRQAYLDEQLLYTRDQSLRQRRGSAPVTGRPSSAVEDQRFGNHTDGAFMTQPPPSPVSQGKRRVKSAVQRPSSGVQSKKPAVRHLYKPANERRAETGIKFKDLFIDSSGHIHDNTQSTMNGLYRLPKQGMERESPGRHEPQLAYDDPRRYTKVGIYDADTAFGQETVSTKMRPPSGVQQRQSDTRRAQHRLISADVPKAERPLKYETTRPISAKTTSARNNSIPTRPSSGHRQHLRTQSLTDLYNAAKNHEEMEMDAASPPPPMKIKIEPPASVKQFTQDLSVMDQMQEEYLKATLDLQKKLGISPGAMIY